MCYTPRRRREISTFKASPVTSEIQVSTAKTNGPSSRFKPRREFHWRPLAVVATVVALIVAVVMAVWLFGAGEDPAVAAARRRKTVAELELLGLEIERVREERLGLAALQAELTDEHLTENGIEPQILQKLNQLGPLVLSLPQTSIRDRGLASLATCPDLVGVSLLGTSITDTGLQGLLELPRLQMVAVERTAVSDAGLTHLARCGQLRQLYLGSTRVTDLGLEQLSGLKQLEALKLSGTEVGDRGLVALADLPRLKYLTLDQTRVTDAGIPVLAVIKSLEFVDLQGTWVSEAGVQVLSEALPNCRIER